MSHIDVESITVSRPAPLAAEALEPAHGSAGEGRREQKPAEATAGGWIGGRVKALLRAGAALAADLGWCTAALMLDLGGFDVP